MKAIILARVSTEEQMNEGQSIPAQLARAREYAKRKGLNIYKEYQFDESSIKDHREKFEQVIEEIKRAKEPVALIVETVDRLQRGFKESVLLDEFRKQGKLEIHFIRENLVVHKDSNSSEIQRWDLAVFLAKSFVLQISDNVKRTNEYKKRHGEWAGKSPIGYINILGEDGKKKDIIPDPARAHLVVRMFELYATGNYSIRTLSQEMKKLGLRTTLKNAKPLTTGMIHSTLQNPFYYGMMRVKNELYQHRYEPLISKELFDKVQQVRLGYHKKPFKYAGKPFVLRGLVKCADPQCGCTITAETHKEHNYYSCTNYKRIHPKRVYVREEDLLAPINEALKNIRLSDEKIQEITDELKKSNLAKNEFHKQSLATLRKEYDLYQKRIDNSFDLMTDGSITKDMFNKKLKEYKEKQAELEAKMQSYTDADENYYLTANITLNLAKKAYEIVQSSEPEEKWQFLNFLLQNLILDGKKLNFELKTPFNTVLQASKCSNLLRW